MNKTLNFLLLSAFIMLGTACGGGGGGGGDAEITDENLEELATAGTEGVKQAVNNDNVSPFAKIKNASSVQDLTVSLAQTVSQNPKFETIPGFCDSGSVDQNFDENGGSITYSNCSLSGVVFNGSATITTSTSGNITTLTIVYNNFTVTFDGEVETIDLEATCTFNNDTGAVSCTYASEALGIDGRTYSVSEISVSGDAFSGYSVSCVVDDPDNGNISITTTTPITFNCPNGQPDNGEIVITAGSDTATITFSSCDSYSVDFNGSTRTFTWP